MFKKIILSFFLLLSQVLPVAQAQQYPGFTTWNEFLTDTLKCDGVKVICQPSLQPKERVFYTDFYCGKDYCINPTGVRVYARTSLELSQLMQTKLNEYTQQYPGKTMRVDGYYGNSYDVTGYFQVIVTDSNVTYPDSFSWRIDRKDGFCEFGGQVAGELGCVNADVDRTSMTDAPCEICSKIGNPFDVRNGAKYEQAVDINFPITLSRNYSSKQRVPGLLGKNWRTNFDKTMRVFKNNNIITSIIFTTPTNEYITMISIDGVNFTAFFRDQKKYKVKLVNGEVKLIRPDSGIETYNLVSQQITSEIYHGKTLTYAYYVNGLLQKVTDTFGRNLSFNYNNASFVTSIVASSGDIVSYSYFEGNIATVKMNNIAQITYEYNNNLITGKLDGNSVKYASFAYDDKGRGIENKHMTNDGHDIKKYTVTYDNNQTKVTQDNGYVADYTMISVNYGKKITNMTGNGISEDASFDSDGNGMSKRNSDGTQDNYNYDSDGRITSYIQDTKNINVIWNTDSNLVSQTVENTSHGTRTTNYYVDENGIDFGYRTRGNGVESYVYKNNDSYGRITTEQNDQGLVKDYTYFPINLGDISTSGLLKSIKSNTGATFIINSYDMRGNPTSVTMNGVTKTMTYDDKGRVLTESVNGATNTYVYDIDGNLTNSTMASGYQMTMKYDTAARLLSIEDNMGGKSIFTNDDYTGEVLKAEILQNNNLVLSRNKIIDTLGRTVEAWNTTTRTKQTTNYGSRGNLPDSTTDANGIASNYGYNMNGLNSAYSTGSDNTNKQYDPDGNINNININNQTTTMDYDDLGRIVSINSPDTGTRSYTYRKDQDTYTDANGTLHTLYKSIGGLPGNHTHINNDSSYNYSNYESYTYDDYGRLVKIQSNNSEVMYTRNSLGQLITKSQNPIVNGYIQLPVQYAYNNIGQKVKDTYPSGLVVNYEYTNGFVTGVKVNGTAIVSNVQYNSLLKEPVSWTLGGRSVVVNKDNDGLLTNFSETGIFNQNITTDNEGHVLSLTDSVSNNNFSVLLDDNYALKSGNINNNTLNYQFSDNHNLTIQQDGITQFELENDYGTNKISFLKEGFSTDRMNYRYDLNGNLLTDHKANYKYDGNNNMEYSENKIMVNGYLDTVTTRYFYNGMNQRIAKQTLGGQLKFFVYNENNQIIGEYDSNGAVIAEYVYFGLRPVAVKNSSGLSIVHTDYLATPRVITSGTGGGSIVWQWKNDNPYGNNKAIGTMEFNLRFAGQYYDSESGLHYNMNRTYNPELGRYMQSDPIGLAGGNNTYNYVSKNPLNSIDPLGLWKKQGDPANINLFGSGGSVNMHAIAQHINLSPMLLDNLKGSDVFIVASHANSDYIENDFACPSNFGERGQCGAYSSSLLNNYSDNSFDFTRNNDAYGNMQDIDDFIKLLNNYGFHNNQPVFLAGCNSSNLARLLSKKLQVPVIGVNEELIYSNKYIHAEHEGIGANPSYSVYLNGNLINAIGGNAKLRNEVLKGVQ